MLLGWRAYTAGEEVASGEAIADAVSWRDKSDFVWLRVADPDKRELKALGQSFDLPELAVEDSVQAHQRPKLERYDGILFMVLRPARYLDDVEEVLLGEIHIFQGPGYCITVRHGEIGGLDDVARRLSRGMEISQLGPAAVLHAVADQVVDAYLPVVRGLERDITEIERSVFDPDHPPPTERIYALMREVLDFQLATSSLLRPLDDLSRGRVPDLPEELNPYFRDVHDHAKLVHDQSGNFRELLNGALQANLAFIGLQENRDQRRISAWAAIALVPTIMGGIWGMNVGSLPFDQSVWGFPILVVLMCSASGYLYWRLRRNNWL